MAGALKGADNAIAITPGHGVGGGVIIDHKIYSGSNYAGAELGHTVIVVDGRPAPAAATAAGRLTPPPPA